MTRPRANLRNFGSPWRMRSLVGVPDGQRYRVIYKDGEGTRRTFGWAGTAEAANKMVNAIRKHPSWRSPKIIDRWARH